MAGRYPLESIIGEQKFWGQTYYLAKWQGFPVEEATYEPARNFKRHQLNTWQAEKARLREVERALELDDAMPVPAPSVPASASVPALAGVSGQAESLGEADREMEDSPVQTIDETLALAAPQEALDAEDDDVKCDDPLGVNLVDKHGEATRCQGKKHAGRITHSCEHCREEAFAMLDDVQKKALRDGADAPLCEDCGEDHKEDPTKSFECVCTTTPQCGACLEITANDLVAASAALWAKNDGTRCDLCSQELDGNETTTKCKSCNGLKVLLTRQH